MTLHEVDVHTSMYMGVARLPQTAFAFLHFGSRTV